MSSNCSTERYAELYAPWLTSASKFTERFVDPGDRVLDLCGGTGAVARAAVLMGCQQVSLLDVNPRVIPAVDGLKGSSGDANMIDQYFPAHSFDVIVCRQAIGYLNLARVAQAAAQTLAPGGRLCFNNFRKPRWFRKRYEFEGDRYSELGWYLGRRVYHIQRKIGSGWDFTTFLWHTDTEVREAMSKNFNVICTETSSTYYYECVIRDL